MTTVRLMSHLPLLRIDADRYDCEIDGRSGALVALPFVEYDDLLLGAFTDARRDYEETSPVFFVRHVDHQVPDNLTDVIRGRGPIAIDPRTGLRIELSFVFPELQQFHADVELLRTAINLAVPRVAVPDPSSSLCILDIETVPPITQTLQGEADQELLFLRDATTARCSPDELDRVAGAIEIVRRARGEVRAAIGTLDAAAAVALGPGEQLALCAITLEALLLPELKSGLKHAFSDRLARLIGGSDDERDRVAATAAALYTARSEVVHGGAPEGVRGTRDGAAQTLLARAVVALEALTTAGETLEELREKLAASGSFDNGTQLVVPPLDAPPPAIGPRLFPRKRGAPPVTWSPNQPDVGENELVIFAPLVGLGLETVPAHLVGEGFPLTWIAPSQLLSLEDPDVRRDWISRLGTIGTQPVACIGLRDDAAAYGRLGYDDTSRSLGPLRRWRDATVATLRLAGHAGFFDPELVGEYVFIEASTRFRLPAIYRQTILLRMQDEPADYVLADRDDALAALWTVVRAYLCGEPSSVIDRALELFRRSHNLMGAPATKAQLLYATLEMVLGRPPRDPEAHPMARLKAALPSDLAAPLHWYVEHGRAVRNAVAHGYWDPNASGPEGGDALSHLRDSVGVALPAVLVAWLERLDDATPAQALGTALDAITPDLDWRAFATRLPIEVKDEHRLRARGYRHAATDLPPMLELAARSAAEGRRDDARLWLTRAAECGSVAAMTDLGVLEKDDGNYDAAREWYVKATAAGDVGAVFNRAILERTVGDIDLARQLFEQAAVSGSHAAMRTLGQLDEEAGKADEALAWYERAAAAGSVNAMNDLGALAASAGQLDTARDWWKRAAAQGHMLSARSLGMVAAQQGNVAEARRWLEIAASRGDEQSSAWLAQLPAASS